MGIELPAELAGIAERTGVQWPEADEDRMQEQAVAWRDAAASLRTLAADADTSATGALDGMSGDAGDQARRTWSGFVDADNGSLTTAARGADQAADRLEHAATQVGEGKVELVRQLVEAARNEDTARAAADGGHPTAMLGVPNLLSAVSTNVAAVTDSLAGSVADTGRALDPSAPVDPNPGGHSGGHGGLLATVSGLPAAAVDGVLDTGTGAADGLLDTGVRATENVLDTGTRATDEVLDTGEAAGRPDVPAVAGPLRPDTVAEVSPEAPTPPSGLAAGGNPQGGASFAEAVTPRAGIPAVPGQTTLAGYADVALPPAGQPSVGPQLPGAAAGAGQPGQGFAPFGGQPAAGPPGGPVAPGVPAGGAGGAVAGSAPGGQAARDDRMPARPHPAGPQQGVPEPRRFAPQPDAAQRPEPRAAPAPEPRQPQPQQQPAFGTPRQDRASIVALFLVHMFPIGHLPVAAAEPARQLPPPEQDVDPFAALRFEPHDHPRSAVFDDAEADPDRAVDGPGLGQDHPAVVAMTDVYDPLAGLHERDWDRRYLVKDDPRAPEYAWPPGEVFPEGCYEDGEPVMLEPGTVLDRFGDPHGRVFAEDATAYHRRALPPPGTTEYRRYRVLQELPAWQGTVAPWFGQPGGGVRYRTVYPAQDLVVLGYLADIAEENPQAGGPA